MTLFKIYGVKIKINIFLILFFIIYIANGIFIESFLTVITVLIHELSHVLACIKFNIKIKEIELFPFGGVAKLDKFIADNPVNEIIISIVGPLTNVVIFLILLIIKSDLVENYYIDFLIKINLYLGLFNLIPILPLDGGRVLRGVLSFIMNTKSATKTVIYNTYIISTLLLIYGICSAFIKKEGIYIILLSVFIIMAAKKEKNMAAFIFIKEITTKKRLFSKNKVLKTQILVCTKEATLSTIIDKFLPGKYHIVIIIDSLGNKIDTIYEEKILDYIIKYGLEVSIERLLIID